MEISNFEVCDTLKTIVAEIIHELLVPIKGIGTAKLIIGLDKNGYYVHYCCTALQ